MVFALLTSLAWSDTGAAPLRRLPLVLTTDCGAEVDDQWALVHLALSPEMELKGIVTTHAPSLAPPAAETSARVAVALLGLIGPEARPRVIAGSSRPLEGDRPRPNPGVEFLIDQARGRSADDRLVVVVIGAATDVASALLIDPTLADRITIVAMGFDGWPEGGDPWNVKNDVRAWRVLLESRAPLVVGDGAIGKRHLAMTPPGREASSRRGAEPGRDPRGPPRGLARQRTARLARSTTGSAATWPIWDEVAVAYLLGMTTSKTYPRPGLRDDMTFDHARPRGTITWITSVDAEALWADLVAKSGSRPQDALSRRAPLASRVAIPYQRRADRRRSPLMTG